MRTSLALAPGTVGVTATLCALSLLAQAPSAVAAPNFSLQGRVVAALPQPGTPTVAVARAFVANAPQPTSLTRPILLPNIQVSLRNASTKVMSAPVSTNPQGYFAIHNLDEGRYQVCVSGAGFTSRCEDRIVSVSRPAQILDHLIEIAPEASALVGAVRLADGTTPCFWYRPSINPQPLVAKVSLLDASSKVVAGPVSGNALGQYVLPVASGVSGARLRVECDAASTVSPVSTVAGAVLKDVSINNRAPVIQALDFTKGGTGVRAANAGDTIRVSVLASDPDGDPLHYAWVDDSGRNLGLPDAPSVDWPLLNATALNTIHVQVTDGKGGFATLSRAIPGGNSSISFDGRVFDRLTGGSIAAVTVSINHVSVKSNAAGLFRARVPDAPQFVLNATKPGYALTSLILRSRANSLAVPLDAAQVVSVNGGTGGVVRIPPGGCTCLCVPGKPGGRPTHGHDRDRHADHDRDRDKDRDKDDEDGDDHEGGDTHGGGNCARANPAQEATVTLPAGALVSSTGARVSGAVSIEGFQYDLSQPNPIPGDFGAIYKGKGVRLGTFGALHIQPRDVQGHALAMAPGKKATISIPIQAAQLAVAPPVIPLFHYDETQGLWVEDGTLTRTGGRYVGQISHFSAFNADTVFPGGACLKVLLDNSFVMPVTLDATYFDPAVGSFNHNGFVTSDTTIGVERMAVNQNFTLKITDSQPSTVSVVLNSGPGLDPVLFPGGLDTDQVNFSHCNGPVQVSNNLVPGAAQQPTFLEFAGIGNATSAANYQAATGAQTGGPKATLNAWKTVNGFNLNGTPASGEASAIYFNNGDLKFGRDMHCRVNASNVLACYVSNFGTVGTDDAVSAIADANAYEASGQTNPAPTATVTMEYDPNQGANAVQFWAYKADGSYFGNPPPALDNQGGKFMPEICMGCHQGTYSQAAGAVVAGAKFLFFDLDSFKDGSGNFFTALTVPAGVETQFHTLNNMVANTSPPAAITTLINQVWYANTTPTTPFTFGTGAAQLPGQPFIVSGVDHAPLYDSVVKIVCRTCHVASFLPWESFSAMDGAKLSIHALACGPGAPEMPNAQVPWLNYWANNRGATLASELSLNQPTFNGCPAP